MREVWKPVVGYEGFYEVSNLGRVKSLKRPGAKERILNQSPNNQGYLDVSLTKHGKRKHQLVHRLVANAFCEKTIGCDVVNHIDNNHTNNCCNNLEWVTQKQNIIHAVGMGCIIKPVIRIGEKDERVYSSITDAQNEGFCPSAISHCCHGRAKTHKGYKWRFAQ